MGLQGSSEGLDEPTHIARVGPMVEDMNLCLSHLCGSHCFEEAAAELQETAEDKHLRQSADRARLHAQPKLCENAGSTGFARGIQIISVALASKQLTIETCWMKFLLPNNMA